MKLVTIIAAAALGVMPALAMAQSTSTQTQSAEGAVTPGGTSQDGLPIFGAGGIPAGAVVVAGVVLLGGVIIGIIAATDDDDTATSTPSTPGT